MLQQKTHLCLFVLARNDPSVTFGQLARRPEYASSGDQPENRPSWLGSGPCIDFLDRMCALELIPGFRTSSPEVSDNGFVTPVPWAPLCISAPMATKHTHTHTWKILPCGMQSVNEPSGCCPIGPMQRPLRGM